MKANRDPRRTSLSSFLLWKQGGSENHVQARGDHGVRLVACLQGRETPGLFPLRSIASTFPRAGAAPQHATRQYPR